MQKTGSSISFLLDGEKREIDFHQPGAPRPTTTVLNYLRSLPDRKGTKEGCAEGDCGACTVSLGTLSTEGKMEYKAFDSCLVFLPMLHGKQLVTVESLGNPLELHPVQQAMVDTDGSQCGYCTPGFIMSLFSLYKQIPDPDRDQIDDALTGNLCRCTGYRPIVEAAAKACAAPKGDQFSEKETTIARTLGEIGEEYSSLSVDTGEQKYFRPHTLREALEIRAKHPDLQIVSGATDIGLLVTKQKQILPALLDLSGIGELKYIRESETEFRIGAGTSLEEIKSMTETHFPALFDMLKVFGSKQIRNIATFGGNIGTASPIGDTPPVLMAYDASVKVSSLSGDRTLRLTDFISGYRETQLASDELITEIILPRPANSSQIHSYKISKRKDLDISTVSAGFRLELNGGQEVKNIQLFYGGMAAMTKRASKAESYLTGKAWTREHAEQAMDLIEAEFQPISDARAQKEGRRVMARNLMLKFWADTQGVS